MGKDVRLVHQAQLAPWPRGSATEGVPDDPAYAEGRVDAFLHGDLGRCALAQDSARLDVSALRAFPDHKDVDRGRGGGSERRVHPGEEPDRPEVDVLVELETEPQNEAALKDAAWNIGVADRPQQDRIVRGDLG